MFTTPVGGSPRSDTLSDVGPWIMKKASNTVPLSGARWLLRGHEGAWIVKKAFPCAALRAALTDEPALPRVSLWPLRGHEGAWT